MAPLISTSTNFLQPSQILCYAFFIFTARRYVSAAPVYVSVTSQSSIETAEQVQLVFGMGASFDLSYTVISKFGYPQKFKIGVLPLETLPQTLVLDNFTISPRQVDRVFNESRPRSSLWITPNTVERNVADG